MLLVAWLIGSALAGTSLPTLGKEVRNSKVLLGVSRVMPIRPTPGSRTSPPSSRRTASRRSSARSPTSPSPRSRPPTRHLRAARWPPARKRTIVKVVGTAQSCGKVLEGTGFVFGERRVMTNAHVVGGVDEPTVQIGGEGRLYDAKVVLYDWQRDIAVLDVPVSTPRRSSSPTRTRAAATARSSPASRRTARSTCARPASAAGSSQRPRHLPPRHGAP